MSQSNAVETTTNASKKSLVEILAIGYLLALAIVMTIIFQIAYLQDGRAFVDINSQNEAAIEMYVLNLIVWPTITVGLYAWHKRGTV